MPQLLARKKFVLNLPFREVNPSDSKKTFRSKFLSEHGISFANLVEENQNDKYVWIYELEDQILAVLSFLDIDSFFYMDIVAINESFKSICDEVHPGFSLFSLLEDLSPAFGYSKIRLDSTSERIEYWKSYGYEMIGMPSSNDKWGKLFPMEKNL